MQTGNLRKERKAAGNKKVNGSFTVEAALVLPLILFGILLLLNQGMELYKDVVKTAEKQEMWEDSDPADHFRKLELLDQIAGS